MLVANFSHPLEIAGRGRETTSRVLDRLQEDSGNRVGTFEFDHFLNSICRPQAKLFFGSSCETHFLGSVVVRVRDTETAGG